MSESSIRPPVVEPGSRGIVVEIDGFPQYLTAQQAYDLHQAVGSVLSQLVQPFEPWPRQP